MIVEKPDAEQVVRAITPMNNRYRDPSTSIRIKLVALWEMGDCLFSLSVSNPHAVGWSVQRMTNGLIKRPTVFRSHKIRSIWESKITLLRDVGDLRALSNLKEMVPLIDPAQKVRRQLTPSQLREIYRHACTDTPTEFGQFIGGLKQQFSSGRLGKPLDRSKHLQDLQVYVKQFDVLLKYLMRTVQEDAPAERARFVSATPEAERRAFSNMSIALTTKGNYRLYKRLGPSVPSSGNSEFNSLYSWFRFLLNKLSDVERARVRRLISAEAFALLSDIVSSIGDEKGVVDFRARQKLSIAL
jgi:hypothetical protein